VEYKQQLKAQRPGPVQNRTRERAKQLLQQKKMWEKQMAQMSGVQFNIEQVAFTQENIVSAIEVSKAMKVGAKDLKAQMKNLSLGEIEDNMDDMADLLEDANEIQETLGRSYAVDDDVDDLELDEELAALDEELGMLEAEVPWHPPPHRPIAPWSPPPPAPVRPVVRDARAVYLRKRTHPPTSSTTRRRRRSPRRPRQLRQVSRPRRPPPLNCCAIVS
jgi:hypothetical protein